MPFFGKSILSLFKLDFANWFESFILAEDVKRKKHENRHPNNPAGIEHNSVNSKCNVVCVNIQLFANTSFKNAGIFCRDEIKGILF